MPITSVQALTDQLRQLQLLDAVQVKDLAGLAQRTDGKTLCNELVRRGWLTLFQANMLLQGRAQDLLIGPYLILDRLGEGGAGQVYKARHQVMKRLVALKVIRRELLADAEVVQRFYREVEVTSTVDSPHVVKAYDAGPVGNNHLLAIEYVDGVDLEKLVAQQGPLPVATACEYIRQAAVGLQHIHEHRLVHRDVKPSNLVLARTKADNVIKVLDLGLARLQQTTDSGGLSTDGSVTMGTPDYLSPEQALDFHGADIRADVYSLGCVFHFLLTGQPPFGTGTLAEKLMRHQQTPAPAIRTLRPEVPAGVAAVLARMMAKRPEDRYQTPGQVAQALAAAPRAGMKRLLLGAASIGVLFLCAGGVFTMFRGNGDAKPTVAVAPPATLPAPPPVETAPRVRPTRPSTAILVGSTAQLQGRESVRDAVIDPNAPDQNFGTHVRDMRLMRTGSESTAFLVRFDLDKLALPRTTMVAKAMLSFFVWDPHNAASAKVAGYPLNAAWDETSATWRQPGPGRAWKNPKGFAIGQDTAATGPTVLVRPDAPGMDTAEPPIEYQLDVTTLVREWVAGGKPNHGMAIVVLSDPAVDNGLQSRFQVYSSRYRVRAYSPKLTIELAK